MALSLSNRLLELDAESGKVLRLWEVGFAPFDVKLAGDKVYVSNWGGRRPGKDDLTATWLNRPFEIAWAPGDQVIVDVWDRRGGLIEPREFKVARVRASR